MASEGAAKSEVRSFDTTTAGLPALSTWLTESGCPCRDGGNRGVYWKPVWHLLSYGEIKLLLTMSNTEHVKNMPVHNS